MSFRRLSLASSAVGALAVRVASPTLLVLALAGAPAGALFAASAGERDEHFQAIVALLDKDFQLPATRQEAVFAKAGYPDDVWFRKALDWYQATRAKSAAKDPAKVAEFDKQAVALRAELDAADEKGQLPAPVAKLLQSSGSVSFQTLKDLRDFMTPDEATPSVARAKERVAIANGQVKTLLDAVRKEWTRGLARVKAFETKNPNVLATPESDPKFRTLVEEGVELRIAALRPAYNGYEAMREILNRGADFGLDPKPVNDFVKIFVKENFTLLSDWEYNYGDFHPHLKFFADSILLEAGRQEIPNIRFDDLESGLQNVLSINPKDFKDPAAREDILTLHVKAVTNLIRTRMELAAGEKDQTKRASHIAKGQEHFANYREAYKGIKSMTPAADNAARAWFTGVLWITSARLHQLKGDSGAASSLLGEVVANKASFAAELASGWLRGPGTSAGGSEWGKPTAAMDPSQALGIAKALRREATASVEDSARRAQLMAAAGILRAGVMGVSGAWSDQFVDHGPELFNLYARTLSELEMRYHAALVAQEGLRGVAARTGKDPIKDSPWRKNGQWTESGKQVASLVRNSMAYASQLASRARGPSVAGVQSDVIETVKRVSPDDAGQNAEWILIVNTESEGDHQRAIQQAKDFLKKYPAEQVKVYGLTIGAYNGWYDDARKTKDDALAKKVIAAMTADAKAMEAEASGELAKNPNGDRAKDWKRVLSTVQASQLSVLMADEKYDEVLKAYGADFWKNPPNDEQLRARLLRALCTAVGGAESKRAKEEKLRGDPQSIIAAWKSYQPAYVIYKRLLPSIKDPGEVDRTRRFGKNMANGLFSLSSLAENVSKTAGAPAELTSIATDSKRGLADLLEPTLTASEKPGTIFFVADTLWNLGEHERAVRLFELFRDAADKDAEMQEFLQDPRAALDAVGEAVGKRPEVASEWSKVRDLVWDDPGLKDLIRQGADPLPEVPANIALAQLALGDFRTKADSQVRSKLGADGWAKADASFKTLEARLNGAAQRLAIKDRLAQGYRELGEKEKASQLYQELYDYDRSNPMYAAAIVEITLDQLRADPAKVDKEKLDKARTVARAIRDDAGKNLDLYWLASIQVWELSLGLGDGKEVANALRFNAVNQSGPSFDLVQPMVLPDERMTGDDKRVRRARSQLSAELANRYLSLFTSGIDVKPSFRIESVPTPDGKQATIFVPVDAPQFEAQLAPNQDDVEILVYVEKGTSAVKPKKPAVAPEAVPAPAPAPAPTPAPEAKP